MGLHIIPMMASPLFIFGCFLLMFGMLTKEIPNNFKFFQNEYIVKFEWVEVIRFNQRYYKQVKLVAFKFNRKTTACNATYTVNLNMGKKLEIVYQLYKFSSNEYRLFPMRYQMNFCTIVENDIEGVRQFFKCGNYTDCAMIKDRHVHICNFVPDSTKFPPYVPSGRYKFNMQGMYENNEVFLVSA